MHSIELGELINIIVDLALLPILVFVLRSRDAPGTRRILVAACLVCLSHTSTILEGFLFPRFFDILEHASLLASGIVFLIVLLARQSEIRKSVH